MHGFLGADFWAEADPRKFSGHGAATPKKLSRFFEKGFGAGTAAD
jgi:hypothetical protein